MLEKLIGIAWDLWEHRNGHLYTHNSILAYELQISQIHKAFDSAYRHTRSDARRFFGQGIDAILNKPPHSHAAWLNNITSALTNHSSEEVQAEQHTLLGMQRIMARFLNQDS